MIELLLSVIAYGLGSIPTSWGIVRLTSWRDLREAGTGRTGFVNTLRTSGLGWALAVAALDVLKGMVAVGLAQAFWPIGTRPWGLVVTGLLVVLGHMYPAFLKLKAGGPAFAPALGAAFVMWPWSALIAGGVAAWVVWRLRHASVAAVLGAALLTGALAYRSFFMGENQAPIFFGLGVTLCLAWSYRNALRRWRRKELG